MVQSVRLSVCPSHLFHYVPIIVSSWNFQELLPLTEVMSVQKVKVTEVKNQLSHFRTVTPVWIHLWWWNGAQSLMWHRGALLVFKVIRQISRSHGKKFTNFQPNLAFPYCKLTDGYETMHKAWSRWSRLDEVPYCFQRSSIKFQGRTGQKIAHFNPNLAFMDCNSNLNWRMAMKLCTKLEVAQNRCPIVLQGHSSNFKVIWG